MDNAAKPQTKRKATDPLPESPAEKFARITESFHLNNRFSDLTIVCRDKVFPAHRVVVCPQSDYFARACEGEFKESSGRIEISDTDPILIEKTLQYLYTGDYTTDLSNYIPLSLESTAKPKDAKGPTSSPAPSNLAEQEVDVTSFEPCFHVLMYEQGTYFHIQGLKDKAKERFRQTFLAKTEKRSLVATIMQVYRSTGGTKNDGLRFAMLQMLVENAKTVYKNKARALPFPAIAGIPGFAEELAHWCFHYLGNVTGVSGQS
ncbi:hypothetical protein HFD88_000131 [Aspergillus terreus]|nr:hypothetical protein HFD88_000131 [Aspergillus terreus]